MRKWMVRLLPALALPLLAFGSKTCNPPDHFSLPTADNAYQTQSLWCWAAAGGFVMNAVRPATVPPVSQCAQANEALGKTDCCLSPSTCNKRGLPDFEAFGFKADLASAAGKSALEWSRVRGELYCKRKPFTYVRRRFDSTKHMLVAVGYNINDDGNGEVIVDDPLSQADPSAIYYDVYVGSPSTVFSASETYYNVRYTGSIK
jgi:hypothetical protein